MKSEIRRRRKVESKKHARGVANVSKTQLEIFLAGEGKEDPRIVGDLIREKNIAPKSIDTPEIDLAAVYYLKRDLHLAILEAKGEVSARTIPHAQDQIEIIRQHIERQGMIVFLNEYWGQNLRFDQLNYLVQTEPDFYIAQITSKGALRRLC